MEWTPNPTTDTRPHHRDRRIAPGVGGSLRAGEYRWPLVTEGENAAHQCTGASRQSPRNKDLHKRQDKPSRSPQDGQHNNNCVCQQDGGHEITNAVTGGLRPLALVPPTGDNLVGRASARYRKFSGRQGIQNTSVISGVDAGQEHMSQSNADPGTMLGGPVCISNQQPTGEVRQLAPRPFCSGSRCLPMVVAGRNWVRISPLCNDREVSSKDTPGRVQVVMVTPMWVTQP